MTVTDVAIVSVAGGMGCMLRVLARDALLRRGAHPWWSTCLVNLSGAAAMGAAGALASRSSAVPHWPSIAFAGLLGGWTTYSAFAMDVVQLWIRGSRRVAATLWAITLLGTPVAAAGGAAALRALSGAAP